MQTTATAIPVPGKPEHNDNQYLGICLHELAKAGWRVDFYRGSTTLDHHVTITDSFTDKQGGFGIDQSLVGAVLKAWPKPGHYIEKPGSGEASADAIHRLAKAGWTVEVSPYANNNVSVTIKGHGTQFSAPSLKLGEAIRAAWPYQSED